MNDFNNIQQWLLPLMNSRRLSVEQLARKSGISRASLYFWLEDRTRPSTNSMAAICGVLGVPLEDGLRQYTPRKVGKPSGRYSST